MPRMQRFWFQTPDQQEEEEEEGEKGKGEAKGKTKIQIKRRPYGDGGKAGSAVPTCQAVP